MTSVPSYENFDRKVLDTMKLLVLSDSHGWLTAMREAVRREQPDRIVHLGDYSADAQDLHDEFPDIPLSQVPGNCDGRTTLPDELVLEVDGVRVFCCHGHRFGVKSSYYRAMLAAREADAQVLLFGHTHRQYCEDYDGLWMLNPGSCGRGQKLNYGIVMVENGVPLCYNVSE
jgi:hypothetical protein